MILLKSLPIGYTARLKDIRLINFTIEPDELNGYFSRLPLVLINGKPVISLLNVTVSKLRPSFLLNTFGFTYQHIAFRLLIKDGVLHGDNVNRGIFYWRSFTNKSFIVQAGRFLTNFNFESAHIESSHQKFLLKKKQKFISYISDDNPIEYNNNLKDIFVNIDRAYSLIDRKMKVTQVKRTDLPLQPLNCRTFETNFFKTAEFVCAFQVKNVLEYEWLPPQNIIMSNLFNRSVANNLSP